MTNYNFEENRATIDRFKSKTFPQKVWTVISWSIALTVLAILAPIAICIGLITLGIGTLFGAKERDEAWEIAMDL
jgi:hypothetical protein